MRENIAKIIYLNFCLPISFSFLVYIDRFIKMDTGICIHTCMCTLFCFMCLCHIVMFMLRRDSLGDKNRQYSYRRPDFGSHHSFLSIHNQVQLQLQGCWCLLLYSWDTCTLNTQTCSHMHTCKHAHTHTHIPTLFLRKN